MPPEDTEETEETGLTLEEIADRPLNADYIPQNNDVDELLNQLVSEGKLSVREATDIINLVGESNPDLRKAAGLLAGEFGVSPRDIAAITQSSDKLPTLKAEDIDEQKRDFLRTAGDIGGSTARFMQSFLRWPTDAAVEGVRDIMGSPSGDTGILGAVYVDEEEWATKRKQEKLMNETRSLIDTLSERGYISNGQATKMKSVTDNWNEGTYADLFEELTTELEGFEYGSQAEVIDFALTLNDLKKRSGEVLTERGTIAPSTASMESDAMADPTGLGGDEQGEFTGLGDSGSVNIEELSTFEDLLDYAGIIGSQMMETGIQPVDKAEIQYVYVDGQKINFTEEEGAGTDAIFDPSTGKVISNSQMIAIQASDAMKKRYAELGRAEGAYARQYTELLESGRFVSTRGNREYTTRYGTGGIPMEDIAAPSAIGGTGYGEEWMRPLYDWDLGAGAAEWRGMAAYSRRAKVNYMVQTGIIRDDERADYESSTSTLGMQMWETVNGVSRTYQMDQYTAMKNLGRDVSGIRDRISGGGYSGSRAAPTYSVPASLRTIPDYKALATETREVFRPQLGRDMEDWELKFLADELRTQYEVKNRQLRTAHRQAWEDGVSGGTVDVSNIEVTDPRSALTFDVEDRYKNELDRQEDVEEYGANRQLLMDSITVGQRMI